MRTQSSAKVKNPRTSRACIDHCSREVCDALHMPDERDDALEGPALEAQLRDGRYDAFILSADAREHGVAISCVITTGPHRGDVVDILSTQFATRDPAGLVGMPCTLVIAGDEIRIED
jgi:hypothetical protein